MCGRANGTGRQMWPSRNSRVIHTYDTAGRHGSFRNIRTYFSWTGYNIRMGFLTLNELGRLLST